MAEPTKMVVTRHPALVAYLIKHGYVARDVIHTPFATIKDVKGKHVFGVLPNWLACHAEKFTEMQLRLPKDKRAVELTLQEIEFYLVGLTTYIIREVSNE